MKVLASAVMGGGSITILCSPTFKNSPLKSSCFSWENQDHCQMPGRSCFMRQRAEDPLQSCDGVLYCLRDFCEDCGFIGQIDNVVFGQRDEFAIGPLGERNQKHTV